MGKGKYYVIVFVAIQKFKFMQHLTLFFLAMDITT
jgi:hypothetical protein